MVIKVDDLPIRGSLAVWGLAAYDHRTGEILMPPFWKKRPFYLVSLAHEVGHMLHHREVGTVEYLSLPRKQAEYEAWARGLEVAKEWGLESEYRKVGENELDPFGFSRPNLPQEGPPVPHTLGIRWP